MKRYIEIVLEKRNVRCVAQLLDEQAPRTSEAVWQALPQSGDVLHAKYASNEIYILVPELALKEPGPENRTIVPSAGDIVYFHLPPGTRLPRPALALGSGGNAVVDLAVFYDRNNLLLSPSEGFTPGNVFATIVRNLDLMTNAGHNVWYEGAIGERMVFTRLDGQRLRDWRIETE